MGKPINRKKPQSSEGKKHGHCCGGSEDGPASLKIFRQHASNVPECLFNHENAPTILGILILNSVHSCQSKLCNVDAHEILKFLPNVIICEVNAGQAVVGCPAKLVSFRYDRNRNRQKFRNYPKQKDLFRFFQNIPKLKRFGSFRCFGLIKKEPKEPKGEGRRREMDGKWKGNEKGNEREI